VRPGPKLTASLWVLALAALVVPLAPEIVWLLAAGLIAALGFAAAEYLALGRFTITVERAEAIALSLDEQETVGLQLTTNAPAALRIELRQLWPGLIETRSSTSVGMCRPGEVLRLEFEIRSVARGTAEIQPPTVAATMWGWAERIAPVGDEAVLSVLPNLKAVKRLHRELNRYVLRGLGSRVSPRLGKGREFDRLRDYVTDDDFRDIAWKASARHDRLIVREYRLDRSQDVLLCLDRGHRMAARTTRISRMDHAVNASVLISYICSRMEDRIGMMAFGAQAEQGIAQGKGAGHLRQLTAYATGLSAEYIHTDYLALAAHLRGRMRHRSLILIITSLPEQDEKQSLVRAVKMLTPQHLPVCIVLSDPALKAAAHFLPADRAELCRTLVARDVWSAKHQMMQELRRLGAWVVETTPEDAGIDSVNAYLDVKRRQLL
jgi:uncharacterized protein (DUF58 family)